jgi:hypothetical protein
VFQQRHPSSRFKLTVMLHGPRARARPRAREVFDIFFIFPQNLKNLVHSRPSLYATRAPAGTGAHTAVLKINASKFTRGLEPLYGGACSAKSLKVLTLVFRTDCSPIDWLQSVLKITRFENVFLFFLFLKNQVSRSRGGEIGLVWCLGRNCCSESDFWQEELFCIANHSAASQLFGDRIFAPCP